MSTMRFSRLCLLSTREGSAYEINFNEAVTILTGPNGTGKSAVLKSIYQTLGAQPHKVDQSWKRAAVSSLLEFEIGDRQLTAIKSRDRYAIVDRLSHEVLVETASVGRELAPVLAGLLDFGLVMPDRDERLVVPPPAYAFAPFYVDQDMGWIRPWASFDRMYLPKSRPTLANYHTGLRTNSYYEAVAQRDALLRQIRELEKEREPLTRAIEEIAKITSGLAIDLNMNSFEFEAEELAKRSSGLNRKQSEFRRKLTQINSEKAIWQEQRAILHSALKDMEQTVSLAAKHPDEVDCPTCGQSYDNSIADRFGLIADYDDIFDAIQDGEFQVRRLENEISQLSGLLAEIDVQILHIDELLSVKSNELSLGDIISAQGRNETTGLLRQKIEELDRLIGTAQVNLKNAESARRRETNPERARGIRSQFDRFRDRFSTILDAPVQGSRDAITSPKLARGSAGTRELLAYYFAVLFSAREHSSSVFCPIVIDAPNQQGQDSHHLAIIYDFLANTRPHGAQIIFSAEEPNIEPNDDINLEWVGNEKNRLLREERYEVIFSEMKPYLDVFL